MNPIPITPSSPNGVQPAEANTSGNPDPSADFGPILRAASGAAAPAPAGPTAPRTASSGRASSEGGREASAKPRARGAPTEAQGAAEAVAAVAAACSVAQAIQTQPASVPAGAHGTAGVAREPTRGASTPIDRAADGAGQSATLAVAATRAAAPASTDPTDPDGADADALATNPATTGLRVESATVTGRSAEPQPAQATAASARAPHVAIGQAAPAPQQESGATDADRDPISGGSVSLAAATPAAEHDVLQAVAQAASASASLGTATSDSAPSHSTAAAAASPTGAPLAGAIAPAPTYGADGRIAIATPVGHPEFGPELSQRVVVLAHGGVQTAQISLQPAELGPVGVSIQVHGQAATVAFTAAHEATRTALEAALPRLRDALAASGLQLSGATVGGRSHSDWSGQARPSNPSWHGTDPGGADPAPATESAPAASPATTRLVDIYA